MLNITSKSWHRERYDPWVGAGEAGEANVVHTIPNPRVCSRVRRVGNRDHALLGLFILFIWQLQAGVGEVGQGLPWP